MTLPRTSTPIRSDSDAQLIQILGDQDDGRAAIPVRAEQVVDGFGRADVDAAGWRSWR